MNLVKVVIIMKKSLNVGEVAELLGVTKTTLRNWDKAGKLVPQRNTVNGYREYSIEDVKPILEESGVQYLPFDSTEYTSGNDDLDIKKIRSLIKRMSAAFRNSSGGGLMERFEEITKLIYTKIYDEKHNDINSSVFFNESNRSYDKINGLYKSAISNYKNLLLNGRGQLSNDKTAVEEIARVLSEYNLSKAKADIKGVAYEELIRNTFEKSENQQFFTPRSVVEFMIDLISPNDFSKTICDPACGSGGFLIDALKYGVDSKNLFGIEIDKRMAWVAQMNLQIHEGENAVVKYLEGDGALGFGKEVEADLPKNGFDCIVTNPPFGSDFTNKVSLSKYELGKGRANRRRGVLFLERCIHWLKPKTGLLAIIIDDSILNGSANEDVRKLISELCEIQAVISLPESTFKPYASVETSILLLKRKSKRNQKSSNDVFYSKADKVGRKPNGDPLFKRGTNGKLILDNDLEGILKDFNAFKSGNKEFISKHSFICHKTRFQKNLVSSNRIDYLFHHPSRDNAEKLLSQSVFPIRKLKDLVIRRNDSLVPNLIDPLSIWRYVGLANIEANTGVYDVMEVFGNQVKSSVGLFKKGELVFSKLRPELRKVFVSVDEEDAYVSSECFVFQNPNPEILNIEYLAFLLRSDLVYGQIVFQISGTGRPRININAIQNINVPLPPISVQNEIVESHKKAHKAYLTHINKSILELEKASEVLRNAELRAKEAICQNLS